MGEVHLARSLGAAGFEKLCIVKTILPRQGKDPQFVERFLHEARVLVQLTHSNIAQVYDMGEVDGQFFMSIEYVAGVDVARLEGHVWETGSQLPIPVALQLGQKIAEALGYAHRKTGPDGAPLGIVHRDVSPQNAMVSYEGEVKVIDFGLAKSAARGHRTQSATVLGKLGYLSPEQARAERVDFRSDIYSCGIVVWELLAGRPLFEMGSAGEMLACMANPKLPSLLELRPEVSVELVKVVERALAADPADRYARADDFARALNERAIREGLTLGTEDLGTYVRDQCAAEFADHRKLISRLSSWSRRVNEASEPLMEPTAIRAPAPKPPSPAGGTAMFGTAPSAPRESSHEGEPVSPALGFTPAVAPPMTARTQAFAGSASPVPATPPDAARKRRTGRTVAQLAGLLLVLGVGVVGGMRLSSRRAGKEGAKVGQQRPTPVSPQAPVPEEAQAPQPAPAAVPDEAEPAEPAPPVALKSPARVLREKRHVRREERREAKRLEAAAAQKEPVPAPAPVLEQAPAEPTPTVPQASAGPAVKAVPTQPVALPPAAPVRPALTVNAKLSGSGSSAELAIQNLDESPWSGCTLTLPDQRQASLKRLEPYASATVSLSRFQGKEGSAAPTFFNLSCKEGSAHVRLR